MVCFSLWCYCVCVHVSFLHSSKYYAFDKLNYSGAIEQIWFVNRSSISYANSYEIRFYNIKFIAYTTLNSYQSF